MVVYIDVLICLNIFVDFLLLRFCDAVLRAGAKFCRAAIASLIGGVSSLYIFAPGLPVPIELLIRLFIAALIILAAYGFGSAHLFIKRTAVFFGVNFIYAGAMFAIFILFKPNGMAINNGVVYFGISPLALIISTLAAYLILRIINHFLLADRGERLCDIRITYAEQTLTCTALVDTGHSLRDMLSDSPVVLVSEQTAAQLLGEEASKQLALMGAPPEALCERYRLIPYSTIGGRGMLPSIRCDSLEMLRRQRIIYQKPIIAISRESFTEKYSAIISAELLG